MVDMLAFEAPFNITNGKVAVTTNYDRIVHNQVLDSLVTNSGERVMNPTWGCNVQGYLFDPSDGLERADTESVVKERLSQQVPRAFVRGVAVASEGNGEVHIGVEFKASQFAPESLVEATLDTVSTA